MIITDIAWIVLLLPLFATVLITLFTQMNPKASAQLSIGAIGLSFLGSVILFIALANPLRGATALESTPVTWLAVGNFIAEFGLRLDPLSLLMILIVTGVGGAIHI